METPQTLIEVSMKWHSIALVGLIGLAVVLNLATAESYLLSNTGLANYVNAAQGFSAQRSVKLIQAAAWFHQARALKSSNAGAYRGLGFIAWFDGRDAEAFGEWQNISTTVHDYIVFGQHAANRETSLRWYTLAERLEPANPELWMEIGQLCQYKLTDAVCERFLAFNRGNWLVDAEFAFDRAAWRFNRREGADYAITECPDLSDKKCALVEIYEVTSPHGTGWYQCLVLTPGRRYRFSAWVKTETVEQWIPVYYQGSVGGVPDGYSLGGIQTGFQDWVYWEREFEAPEFDDHRACFHPVRLLAVGRTWFHSAALSAVE